jgi:enoyl-CoA hydratase
MSIDVRRDGVIATITINRPDALNAFSTDQIQEMIEQLESVAADDAIRAVIITGAGDKAFVAGADIQEMSGKTRDEALEFARQGHRMCNTIESMPKPVIAAINGFALGGGCEIALACDVRVASENAMMGQPEVLLGIPPGWGGTQRLPRIVGMGYAKELIFSGRRIGAEEAHRMGLVNSVCSRDALLEEARAMALSFLKNAPGAVALSKQLINQTVESPISHGKHAEMTRFADAFNGAEQKEGMKAFLERRKPSYSYSESDA